VPCAIRGILWYQGESITPPKELFPLWNETLINDWRKLWGRELPFYFCQLAALQNNSNNPQVREWQAGALNLPKTAMAVTIDIGDEKNVHPKDKQDVGDRLTRIALAKVYGRKIEYSGPVYESMKIEGNAVRLKFSHPGGGLIAKNGPLQTFEIAGPARSLHPPRRGLTATAWWQAVRTCPCQWRCDMPGPIIRRAATSIMPPVCPPRRFARTRPSPMPVNDDSLR